MSELTNKENRRKIIHPFLVAVFPVLIIYSQNVGRVNFEEAIVPIIYVKIFYNDLIYVASLSAFLGHVFPIWLKFKGGKGVATFLGILFALNFVYGFIFICTWIFTFILSKYSSLSSIISSASIPIYLFFNKGDSVIFFIIMFVLIFYTHRENIKRLKNKI